MEDLDADEATGAWNPVTATGADRTEVRRLCDDAVHGIRLALSDAEFVDGRLARALLGGELERAVDRVFDPRHRHHQHRPQARGPRVLPWLGRRTTADTLPGTGTGTGTECGVRALTDAGPQGATMASGRPSEDECRRCGQWRQLCRDCRLCFNCCTCNEDEGPDDFEPWQSGEGSGNFRRDGSGRDGSRGDGSGGDGWSGGSGGGNSGGYSGGSGGSGGGGRGSGGSGGDSGDGCCGGGGCCNPCKCCCDCCD